ncbi:hypothetical protein DACRYDRAFT_106475 [Dacryopinax primogenitus]|uniref:Uncharacterized protein n=1 Tax=Dacryopinax primogenitus (strain DJM 731) TaxID=1858805 RepID=M5FZ46_DACPD|nr:uncharacterized protein DACRYDRAFT_106475 [Dacryopinax primogenitus]EJU03316.1 hypothetical protein DACRYDRAFT_106475 [Dacryopinax primogenitus]
MLDVSRLVHLTLECCREVGIPTSINSTPFITFFKRLTELRSLSIDCFALPPTFPHEGDQEIIYLPNLTTIKVCNTTRSNSYAWLAQFLMPSLRSVEMAPSFPNVRVPSAAQYFATMRTFFSIIPNVANVTMTVRGGDSATTGIFQLLLEEVLPRLQTFKLRVQDEEYGSSSVDQDSVPWSKNNPRDLKLLVNERWQQGRMLSELRVDPPLFPGDNVGKNYALELLRPMAEIGGEAEFGLEDLFGRCTSAN